MNPFGRLVAVAAGLASAAQAAPDALAGSLHADARSPSLSADSALFEPLIGSWDVDVVDFLPDGARREQRGEWHFGWVLEGRAIEDVFIVPARGLRDGAALEGNRYGATLRTFDAASGAWRIAWFNAVTGARNDLVARRVGERIVQEGVDADGERVRWTFSEITPDGFVWRGEGSSDGGRSWRLGAEFRAHRRGAAADPAPGGLARRAARPLESHPGVETRYAALAVAGGARLRMLVTRPAQREGRLPAILFVPWLSCDTVELTADADDGWSQLLRGLVRESRMVVVRVDKAGVGDSQGGPCERLDYETELAHHRAALAATLADPWVDPQRVFVFGASMGATYAPLIAAGQPVRGVAVWGGGAHSWFERQLALERRRLELGGSEPAELDTRIAKLARFYSAFLLEGRTPVEIAKRDPALAQAFGELAGAAGETQFGRPLAFHQQAQAQHWAAAWARIEAPTLVLRGAYDWFEQADSARLVAEIVNRRRAGLAELHEIAGMDHHFALFPTPEAAFRGEGGRADAGPVLAILLRWLSMHGSATPSP